MPFKLTEKQKEALNIITKADTRNLLLYGGSQSAKTFFAIYYIILRCLKYPTSTHAICRLRLVDVKAAILLVLFRQVIELRFGKVPDNFVHINMSPPIFARFLNGSKIFFLGLDDKQNSDKILGRKFTTVLLDEISEISFSAYSKIITRLSETVSSQNVSICTMNPTTKKGWAYKLFISGVNPKTDEPLKDASRFKSFLMNPKDNLDNLPKDYIESLENLSPQDKERFLFGRFGEDLTGTIYAEQIQAAINEGRIARTITISPTHFLYAVFDLGIRDMMAVWIVQYTKDKIIFIDYFQKQSFAVTDMLTLITKKYRISGIYLPHDANNRWVGIGMSVLHICQKYSAAKPMSKQFFTSVTKRLGLWEGINACRTLFSRCYFITPETELGLDMLKSYKYKYIDQLDMFDNNPMHDGSSHGADAFRYAIINYSYSKVFQSSIKPPSGTVTFQDLVSSRH